MNIKSLKIEDFLYNLPEERIAKYPLSNRDESKLLIYNKGEIFQKPFKHLPDLFTSKDLIVFNNTKVIQARLIFHKSTGAKIEIFCLEPVKPSDYEKIFQENETCVWSCMIGNKKKWKKGELFLTTKINNEELTIKALKEDTNNNSDLIRFSWENEKITFGDILENTGKTPIPPYLNRHSEHSDKERYQTIYSKLKGSVAAPTAGLHFTKNIFQKLNDKDVQTDNITLHVGAGTFKPVKSEHIGEHEMHTEHFSFDRQFIEKLIKHKGNITATGTTTVRTLESIYWLGVKLFKGEDHYLKILQWEIYSLPNDIKVDDALNSLIKYMDKNNLKTIDSSTQIIIAPGYKFRIINKLITNFHMPKSTLLLLIAAFIGDNWSDVYNYALNNDFRFLSYGDSSILIPPGLIE